MEAEVAFVTVFNLILFSQSANTTFIAMENLFLLIILP